MDKRISLPLVEAIKLILEDRRQDTMRSIPDDAQAELLHVG
ncbi:MAG: hypothetical protein ACOCTS_02150 [Thermodesulfobacteriota bacterium]